MNSKKITPPPTTLITNSTAASTTTGLSCDFVTSFRFYSSFEGPTDVDPYVYYIIFVNINH